MSVEVSKISDMSDGLQCALSITAWLIVFFADKPIVCFTHNVLGVFIFRVCQAPKVRAEQKEARVTRLAYSNNNNLNIHKYLSKYYSIYIAYLIYRVYFIHGIHCQ